MSEQANMNEKKSGVVDEQVRRRAETVALVMGGDYNMSVGVGEYGSGWHWDFNKNHVNMDPKDLMEDNIDVVRGVAAHEGNHRSFSRADDVQDLWQEPGFSFGYNAMEDPRVNQGGIKFRPGSRKWIQAYIEKDLGQGGGLDYEDLKRDAKDSLGYVPKYMQWGSEMIRYWHDKELGSGISTPEEKQRFLDSIPDEDVREKVEKAIPAFEQYYSTLPDTKDEVDVRRKAKESNDVFRNDVWPEYRNLVDKSYQDHSLVKMIEDMVSQQKEDQDSQGGEQGQGGKTGKGQSMSIPFSSLPKEVQDEIKKKMKDANSGQKPSGKDNSGDKANQEPQQEGNSPSESGSSAQNQSGQEPGQSGEPATQNQNLQGTSGQSSQEQPNDNSQGSAQDQVATDNGEAGEQNSQNPGQGTIEDLQQNDKKEEKVPWDQLSDQAKKAVKEAFDNLPADQKEKYKKEASTDLEDAEDSANEKLRGKMTDPRSVKTHKEDKQDKENQQQKAEERQQAERDLRGIEKKSQEALDQIKENPYHEILNLPDIASIIRQLDREYQRIFAPDQEPNVRHSYSGLRPSMYRAMQRDADPKRGNIFEVKGRPMERSHRFLWLIDMSGSMKDKIAEVFKFMVIASELANKHKLENAIIGFTDTFPGGVRIYKDFDVNRLDQKARDNIGQIVPDCLYNGGRTPTVEATEAAYKLLKKRIARHPMQHNYLIALTDGQSTSSTSLLAEINRLRKDPTVVNSGFGIGPDTEFVNTAYPPLNERIRRDIAKALNKPIEEISNSFSDTVEFATASVIIMKYMVEHPELFTE